MANPVLLSWVGLICSGLGLVAFIALLATGNKSRPPRVIAAVLVLIGVVASYLARQL